MPAAARAQRVDQRGQDARAAGADGMARARWRRRAYSPCAGSRPSSRPTASGLRRERLVELEQVHLAGVEAGALQRQPHGADRPEPHDPRLQADDRVGQHPRHGLAARRANAGDATTSAAAPSLMPEALPAVTVPSVANAGLSAGQPLDGRAGPRMLVACRPRRCVFFGPGTVTGTISSRERARLRSRAPHAPGSRRRRRPARRG